MRDSSYQPCCFKDSWSLRFLEFKKKKERKKNTHTHTQFWEKANRKYGLSKSWCSLSRAGRQTHAVVLLLMRHVGMRINHSSLWWRNYFNGVASSFSICVMTKEFFKSIFVPWVIHFFGCCFPNLEYYLATYIDEWSWIVLFVCM